MKQFKADIANAMLNETKNSKIVMLKDVAKELGFDHVSTLDCYDIIKLLKSVDGYHLIRIMMTENDSLFQSLALIADEVEFDDGDEIEIVCYELR